MNGCCHLRLELNVSVKKPSLWRLLAVTRTRRLASACQNPIPFTLLPSQSPSPVVQPGCSATVRTLPQLPTTDAAESPASEPLPPRPASWRSCPHVRLTSTPNALDLYPVRAAPLCTAPPAPAASADTDLLPS